eukprot:Clim_evm14s223 gene=Clim_evmTU14s223
MVAARSQTLRRSARKAAIASNTKNIHVVKAVATAAKVKKRPVAKTKKETVEEPAEATANGVIASSVAWKIGKRGAIPGLDGRFKCWWCVGDPLYEKYHDEEWGRVVQGSDGTTANKLFEMLCLEGFQAGLSFSTILKKRDGMRVAFDHFDIQTVAAYDTAKINLLMQNPSVIRMRQKIKAAINNAQVLHHIGDHTEHTTVSDFFWSFVPGDKPMINTAWSSTDGMPKFTDEAAAMSKALKRLGFRFVGPTTCMSFMQAAGMVNHHLTECHRHPSNTSEK